MSRATLLLLLALASCSPNPASSSPVAQSPQGSGGRATNTTSTTLASTTTLPPTTTTTRVVITDPRIFLMGDSVMAALNPDYTDDAHKVLGGLGWDVTIDAQESRFPTAGIQVLKARRAEIGQVVVIQMSNNYGDDEAQWADQIDTMFDVLDGVREVVFLTVSEFQADRRQVNDELRAALERHPNMVLADWNLWGALNPAFLAGDGLHLTVKGAHAMAQMIADRVGEAPGYDPFSTTTTTRPRPTTTTTRASTTTSSSTSSTTTPPDTTSATTTAATTPVTAPTTAP